eukprot:CAMPEP_0198199464 /NCGR_PEP_ID=MMETSP1445-20131203/2765_1 /TAXON_ID=36898 /ORGANISM="Pyramimonas sp., Strain CCMP2087" /LENGTH=159 /DNA_ID=CAMNT_0043869321 /DNA_START=1010 /DNA_END=1489 /DNA_ORIENTATION=+
MAGHKHAPAHNGDVEDGLLRHELERAVQAEQAEDVQVALMVRHVHHRRLRGRQILSPFHLDGIEGHYRGIRPNIVHDVHGFSPKLVEQEDERAHIEHDVEQRHSYRGGGQEERDRTHLSYSVRHWAVNGFRFPAVLRGSGSHRAQTAPPNKPSGCVMQR